MVTPDGLVKILDFGLAKLQGPTSDAAAPDSGMSDLPTLAVEQASPATSAGAVLGTAGYMSPEQARGRPVDHRSDQFALGTTLYEMATGHRAFHGETRAQALAAILEKDPEPITRLCPSFPAPARWIVERCLAKDPADRYASTLDLARELRGVREHLSEVGRPGLAWAARPWAAEQVRRLRRGLRPWHGLAAGAALAAAALLAAGPLRPSLTAWIESRTPLPAEKHVALLPFEVESPDPEDRFRADGLLEVMTSRLVQLEPLHADLTVVPASDVWQSGVTTAEAARRAFDVNLVVTGRVERVDDRLRLVAHLEDAVRGRRLRTLPAREFGLDALSLQGDMTRAVARLLEVPLRTDDGPVQGGTPVAGAYAHYVQARGHIQRFERRENVEEAISLLQRALEQDPDYAPAYAALGEAYWRLYELTRRPELVDLARENCGKALALNELMSPAYVTLGIIERGTGEPEKSLADLQRALDRDPRNADALRELGWTHLELGRPDRGEEALRRALALRSTDWATHNYLGLLLVRQERFDESEKEFRRVIALNPEIPRGYSNLGVACYRQGKLDEAERMFRRSVEIRPTPAALSNLGTTLFYLRRYGETAEALPEGGGARRAQRQRLAQPRAGPVHEPRAPGGGAGASRAGARAPRGAAAGERPRRGGSHQPRRHPRHERTNGGGAEAGRSGDRARARVTVTCSPSRPRSTSSPATARAPSGRSGRRFEPATTGGRSSGTRRSRSCAPIPGTQTRWPGFRRAPVRPSEERTES